MNEPPSKPPSILDRLRSLPLKAWVVILAVETMIFLALIVVFVFIVFRK